MNMIPIDIEFDLDSSLYYILLITDTFLKNGLWENPNENKTEPTVNPIAYKTPGVNWTR